MQTTSQRNWRAHHLLDAWTRLLDPTNWRDLTLPTMPTWIVTRPGSIYPDGVVDPDQAPPSPTVPRPRHEIIVIPYHPKFHPGMPEQILITPTHYWRTTLRLAHTHPDPIETLRHYRNSRAAAFAPRRGHYTPNTEHAQLALALEEAHP